MSLGATHDVVRIQARKRLLTSLCIHVHANLWLQTIQELLHLGSIGNSVNLARPTIFQGRRQSALETGLLQVAARLLYVVRVVMIVRNRMALLISHNLVELFKGFLTRVFKLVLANGVDVPAKVFLMEETSDGLVNPLGNPVKDG